jgi:hypothetical protein
MRVPRAKLRVRRERSSARHAQQASIVQCGSGIVALQCTTRRGRIDVEARFGAEERRHIEAALHAADPLSCPACGGRVTVRAVQTPDDISYVRHRVWVRCAVCLRSAPIDLRRA